MQREFKFKAWNRSTNLLMRLNSIDCLKGRLFKKDHILLQYTGFVDESETELYEMDIVLLGSSKHMLIWDDERSGWSRIVEYDNKTKYPLNKQEMMCCVRLCNYYESPDVFQV